MSWVGWLILAALFFYLPVVLARGAVELWYWFLDNFTNADVAHREEARTSHREERRRARRSGSRLIRESGQHPTRTGTPPKVRLVDPLGLLIRWGQGLFTAKHFDYWIARALEEGDPAKKVKYCTKAVELNPAYVPGWGLKGTTLLEMQRYAEAQQCFDKVLELAPSALAWYRKGLCCHHLKQYDEAVRCFNKTLDTCASSDRTLADDAARYKELARAAISSTGPATTTPEHGV
jgi:tetratricopeptide (TPR) repeat protein